MAAPNPHRARILELAALGISSKQIIAEIGDGLTKNAVIGVCFRAGVPLGTTNASNAAKSGWHTRRGTVRPLPVVPGVDLAEAARQIVAAMEGGE